MHKERQANDHINKQKIKGARTNISSDYDAALSTIQSRAAELNLFLSVHDISWLHSESLWTVYFKPFASTVD